MSDISLQKQFTPAPSQEEADVFVSAARAGEITEVAAFLRRYGTAADARDKFGHTALLYAAENGYAPVVELLLKKGADVNETSMIGTSPLMEAAREGHKDIVEILLNKGALPDKKDLASGKTALMYAARNGHRDVVAQLLGSGCAVDAKDMDGQTALIYAAGWGHKDVVALLLNGGAGVNEKTRHGATALMQAVMGRPEMPGIVGGEEGYAGVIRLLLEKGADLDARDYKGRTARQHAEAKKKTGAIAAMDRWIEKEKQRLIAEQAAQHEQWLKDTDFHKGLKKPIPAVRPFRLPPGR